MFRNTFLAAFFVVLGMQLLPWRVALAQAPDFMFQMNVDFKLVHPSVNRITVSCRVCSTPPCGGTSQSMGASSVHFSVGPSASSPSDGFDVNTAVTVGVRVTDGLLPQDVGGYRCNFALRSGSSTQPPRVGHPRIGHWALPETELVTSIAGAITHP